MNTKLEKRSRPRVPLTEAETRKLLWFQNGLQSMLSEFYTQEGLAKHLGLAPNMVSRLLGRGEGSYLNRGVFPGGKGSGPRVRQAEEKIRQWLESAGQEAEGVPETDSMAENIPLSLPGIGVVADKNTPEESPEYLARIKQVGRLHARRELDTDTEVNTATERLISELDGAEGRSACPTDLRGLRIVSRGFDYANLIDFHLSSSYPILAWTYTLADVKKLVGTVPLKYWSQVWVLSDSEASVRSAQILWEATGGAVNLRPSLRDHRKILIHSGDTVLIGSANFGHTLNREAMVEIVSESLYQEVYQEFVKEWRSASRWGFRSDRSAQAQGAAKGTEKVITV